MKFRIATLAIGVWSIVALHSTLRAQQPSAQTPRSVLDGVYTEEQTTRGASIYVQECASCHGPTLDGVDDKGPPLSGTVFMENWTGLTVGNVFERIRVSMPQDDPGRLASERKVDVLAYMLSVGKFPAGNTELPREAQVLSQIRYESTKP